MRGKPLTDRSIYFVECYLPDPVSARKRSALGPIAQKQALMNRPIEGRRQKAVMSQILTADAMYEGFDGRARGLNSFFSPGRGTFCFTPKPLYGSSHLVSMIR
jgi:hypothetical protein